VDVPVDQRVIEAVEAANVDEQGDHGRRIAEQADEDRCTRDGLILLQPKDVDGC
jgi:hypothetical protein